ARASSPLDMVGASRRLARPYDDRDPARSTPSRQATDCLTSGEGHGCIERRCRGVLSLISERDTAHVLLTRIGRFQSGFLTDAERGPLRLLLCLAPAMPSPGDLATIDRRLSTGPWRSLERPAVEGRLV